MVSYRFIHSPFYLDGYPFTSRVLIYSIQCKFMVSPSFACTPMLGFIARVRQSCPRDSAPLKLDFSKSRFSFFAFFPPHVFLASRFNFLFLL